MLRTGGLNTIGSAGAWQSILSVVATAALLAGTVLPAVSGVILWMRRRSPQRLWAADQVTHGRLFGPAVSTAIIDGVIGGCAIAGLSVLADMVALGVSGFVPSISSEVSAVNAGIGSMIGDTLGGSSFLALGIALAVETLDRLRLHPIVSTPIVAVGAGLVAASNQTVFLAALPLIAGMAAGAALAAELYRRRGFLATWMACLVAGFLTNAMAARSLEDPELVRLSNLVFTIVGLLAAIGVWGLASARFRKRPAAVPVSSARGS